MPTVQTPGQLLGFLMPCRRRCVQPLRRLVLEAEPASGPSALRLRRMATEGAFLPWLLVLPMIKVSKLALTTSFCGHSVVAYSSSKPATRSVIDSDTIATEVNDSFWRWRIVETDPWQSLKSLCN
ncbi:hypothetical protein [Methylomonas koyamae]|uniref:hypothetical protein n=1 Tax=Methylomonas koyamae TaxID=702114 RepID=UPI002873BD5B|nr:hypothetical protein [Methylomonas koyamae]WNB76632.1 hypothetical protein RI210_03375 [Methylomonas koyamae]